LIDTQVEAIEAIASVTAIMTVTVTGIVDTATTAMTGIEGVTENAKETGQRGMTVGIETEMDIASGSGTTVTEKGIDLTSGMTVVEGGMTTSLLLPNLWRLTAIVDLGMRRKPLLLL